MRAWIVVWCLMLAGGAAFAQDPSSSERLTGTLKKIKDSGVVVIGYRAASLPFSYARPGRPPIGYSIDLCLAIVEAIKSELGMNDVAVSYAEVTPRDRIERVVKGAVDLECGQTTNNAERRRVVAFSPSIFISGTKLLARSSARFKSYRDLKGKRIVVTAGTTNETAIRSVNDRERLQFAIVPASENADAFRAVAAGQADAWAGDDVVLFAAAAPRARDFAILDGFLSYEPYGIMYRIDPALDALVQRTFEDLAQSRELARTYEQWFLRSLPSGERLGVAISPELESVFESLGQPPE